MSDVQDKIKRMWKNLNEMGIYTMEEFEKAYKELPPLDVSIMVAPLDIDNDKSKSVG